jgi:PIN domain nuclease of toxin-antitoxin system
MVVLDTHAWLWLNDDPGRLSRAARAAVDAADSVGVPAVSCWELGMLVLRGRIALDREVSAWVQQALSRPGTVALPLSPMVALAAALLEGEGLEGDPPDRFIYAAARDAGAKLVTRDSRLREFDPRGTVW